MVKRAAIEGFIITSKHMKITLIMVDEDFIYFFRQFMLVSKSFDNFITTRLGTVIILLQLFSTQ